MDPANIRNFSIIAHIDHGKSTLADRLLEISKSIDQRQLKNQFLDNMDIERERGITIKAQAVRLTYKAKNGETYYFNLVDTPGHVDFSYEVGRSLACCEAALLVVDVSQGVQAQTLANVYMAIDNDLEIVPVLNKVDLPHADVEKTIDEIENIVGIEAEDACRVSAKSGVGVEDLLETLVHKIPAPKIDPSVGFQAMIFDSWFDTYRGVIVLVRVFNGKINKGDVVHFKFTDESYEVISMAVNAPLYTEVKSLAAGEVGMIICGIKTIRDVTIGDTIVLKSEKDSTPSLDGLQEIRPMVFCGIFPVDSEDYENLVESIEKLALNDSSFTYEKETSDALGYGYRCGFLGPLHMNIVQERLEREFKLNLICTAPSCKYLVTTKSEEEMVVENPSMMPDPTNIQHIKEPYVIMNIHVPNEFVGNIIKLCEERRGLQQEIKYITPEKVQIVYDIPLNEMVFDFYDQLKSMTKGYATMDYEVSEYKMSDLVKVDILINGDRVDALSCICHRQKSTIRGKELVSRLRKIITRHQFDIAIQAAIGAKIISRETVKALRKNVLAKCYGGDISRKRKLLEKQKEGKKRMKMVGSVEIPQEAFLAVLKVDE